MPRDPLHAAIRARDVGAIETVARAREHVDLDDALAMIVMLAELDDPRYPRWAERWAARVAQERRLQPAAREEVRGLLRELRRENAAGAVALALRSYAVPQRTWS